MLTGVKPRAHASSWSWSWSWSGVLAHIRARRARARALCPHAHFARTCTLPARALCPHAHFARTRAHLPTPAHLHPHARSPARSFTYNRTLPRCVRSFARSPLIFPVRYAPSLSRSLAPSLPRSLAPSLSRSLALSRFLAHTVLVAKPPDIYINSRPFISHRPLTSPLPPSTLHPLTGTSTQRTWFVAWPRMLPTTFTARLWRTGQWPVQGVRPPPTEVDVLCLVVSPARV